jgi:hypothetical protein
MSGISKNKGFNTQSGSERAHYYIGLASISLSEFGCKHLGGHFVNEKTDHRYT